MHLDYVASNVVDDSSHNLRATLSKLKSKYKTVYMPANSGYGPKVQKIGNFSSQSGTNSPNRP